LGKAEPFVRTMKRDYARVSQLPDAAAVIRQLPLWFEHYNTVHPHRKRFSHRIDMWDDDGENVLEHLAGVEDFDLAMATYRAACLRGPGAAITIRQSARIIEDSRKRRLA
jgi:hypothetical protein